MAETGDEQKRGSTIEQPEGRPYHGFFHQNRCQGLRKGEQLPERLILAIEQRHGTAEKGIGAHAEGHDGGVAKISADGGNHSRIDEKVESRDEERNDERLNEKISIAGQQEQFLGG